MKTLIGMYMEKTGVAAGFGAAGLIVMLQVWVYYSAHIFLLAAEFTRTYPRTFGSMKAPPTQATAAPTTLLLQTG